jgi:hypothetical protein
MLNVCGVLADSTMTVYVSAAAVTFRASPSSAPPRSASLRVSSIVIRPPGVAPRYEPWLSVAYVSIAVCAVRTSALASASRALSLWLKNEGMAIAASRPRINITTRSSTRVKPSSRPIRSRSF